jgi:hypothetical protein
MKKLGVKTSRTNVVNILRGERIDPKTDPSKGNWGQFLKAHATSLWQCDFFSKHIMTAKGSVRQCFALAFVHVASRRVREPLLLHAGRGLGLTAGGGVSGSGEGHGAGSGSGVPGSGPDVQ